MEYMLKCIYIVWIDKIHTIYCICNERGKKMILTDKSIRELCRESNTAPLIKPFVEESLQSESYDLTIGSNIAVLKKELKCLDIKKQQEIDSIYEVKLLNDEGYIISPKEYVLVSLREKLTLTENITAHIRPRTRYTRMGLLISDQHCNSTYSGMLQIGLFNATDYAIKIFPGVKIAQIVFEELVGVPSENKLYKNKANAAYQNENSFIGGIADPDIRQTVDTVVDFLLNKGDQDVRISR